jgi:hypothetical protein
MSEEQKIEQSDKFKRKPIYQIDMKTGQIIKEWFSAGEASRELGVDKSGILRVCKGIRSKAYWFLWRFKEDYDRELANKYNSGSTETNISL